MLELMPSVSRHCSQGKAAEEAFEQAQKALPVTIPFASLGNHNISAHVLWKKRNS